MSRVSAHMKSQSTSALSVIAAGSSRTRSKQPDLPPVPSHPAQLPRPSSSSRPSTSSRDDGRGKRHSLESVSEEEHAATGGPSRLSDRRSSIIKAERTEEAMPPLPDISEIRRVAELRRQKSSIERAGRPRKVDANEEFVEKVRGWLKDIMSLRSSPRRRIAGLENFEKLLIGCCLDQDLRSSALPSILKLNAHTLLLSLLTRHASTLIARAHSTGHSALGASDELVLPLIPELTLAITTLQGLCLIDTNAKAACGDAWTLEMFIDLLLLLRTQSPPKPGDKPVVYCVLELMLAVLVDSPATSRTFEKLQGLEAVMRVLKGTGVIKDVRMKCIEFIYFWLQPEEAVAGQRSASNSSTSSASSADSVLYPPSPLGSSTSSTSSHLSTPSYSSLHLSPSPTPDGAGNYALPRSPSGWKDIDIPFIPQTPRKPPQPTLGYLTPASRRVSAGGKSTPGLPTVPGSPVVDLSIADEREDGTPKATPVAPPLNAGLGLGLPHPEGTKSPTIKRDVTAIRLSALTDSPDPFDSKLPAPSPRKTPSKSSGGLSRSSTQPSLTIIQSSPQSRKVSSSRRLSKSPLAQPATPDSPPPVPPSPLRHNSSGDNGERAEPRARMRHSKTQSLSLAAIANSDSPSTSMAAPPLPPLPSARPSSRMRHSRTQSHLSSFAATSSAGNAPPPPVPGLPPVPRHRLPPSRSSISIADPNPPSRSSSGGGSDGTVKRVSSNDDETTPPALPAVPTSRPKMPPPADRTPSRAKRGFPVELTKGLPPSASSPALSALGNTSASSGPLMARKRIPSGGARASLPEYSEELRGAEKERAKPKDVKVRSVEEKKEMLGAWLGNVDALVSGVERVSFWGSGAGRS